jgi:peptide/nickel transport system substrate-binding protein
MHTPQWYSKFVLIGVTVLLLLWAAGCAAPAAPLPDTAASDATGVVEETTQPTDASASSGPYGEAPDLAARVAAGELPPVDERLPVTPLVVPVVERIGVYGGDWNLALRGGNDNSWFKRTINYEHLVRWNPEWTEVIPNIAESFEASADATVFTFTLREGMKWSDGAPFTVDDIMFWYEDVFMHDEITPVKPAWLLDGEGNPPAVERLDDTSFSVTYPAPNGLFIQRLASSDGVDLTRFPRHYLEQFHQSYNPEGIDEMVAQEGLADWIQLLSNKGQDPNAVWRNPDLPSLHAWQILIPYSGDNTRVVAERNPYYWKVDPEGNQLPYINRTIFEIGEDVETLVLKALNGEIDMQDRHIGTPSNKAVFFDNMEAGNYRFFDTVPEGMNTMVIALNLTHKDPVKREMFGNKEFRIALSHAINRQEIIDVVYIGQGEPYQPSPRPESIHYDEEFAKQYTEYDPDLANQMLDALYPEKNSGGIRLDANGAPIAFSIEVASTFVSNIDALEMIRDYWLAVGVDMQVKVEDRSLLYTRKEANDHDAVVWAGDGGLGEVLEPRWYFPYSGESNYAIPWAYWFRNDPRGEEPPAYVQEQMDRYRRIIGTGDSAEQVALMGEILDIAKEQFYVMGLSLPPNGYGIVKNNFHNVPAVMPSAGLPYPNPAPTNPPQYFIEGEE